VRARVLLIAVGAVVVVEALVLGALPGAFPLRRFVDLLAGEGLLLAVVGAFLLADRPFLAARTLARRVPPRDAELREDARPKAGAARTLGYWTFGAGAMLFGFAALLWALRGTLPL
jgi:hypothetical protein